MAVTDIGLSAFGSESPDRADMHAIRAGATDAPVHLKWRTMSGAEFNASFDIALNYRYVPRGIAGGEDGGWTPWQTDWSTWANVPLSDCSGTQLADESGWEWSLDLATLLGLCGIKEAFTDDSDFGFGSRKFDRAEIGVHIKSQYLPGFTDASGSTHSPRTDSSVVLDFVPRYAIERVWCDTVGQMKIRYSANGWERLDDRWCIEALDVSGANVLPEWDVWGTVVRHDHDGDGTIVVPVDSLASHPIGREITLEVRFNPSYAAVGAEFARSPYAGVCENDAECNTPTLAVSVEDGTVKVTVKDSGDKDKAITECLVKLDGGEFAFDQQTVAVGETASFPFAPRGVPLSFIAVATAGEGTISASSTATAEPLPALGLLVVAPLSDPYARASAKWNATVAERREQEVETIKLAGRARPCAYYGEGGAVAWSAVFALVPFLAEGEQDTEAAWRKAARSGDCVMMLDDGRRAVVSLSGLRIERTTDPDIVNASIELSEVEA